MYTLRSRIRKLYVVDTMSDDDAVSFFVELERVIASERDCRELLLHVADYVPDPSGQHVGGIFPIAAGLLHADLRVRECAVRRAKCPRSARSSSRLCLSSATARSPQHTHTHAHARTRTHTHAHAHPTSIHPHGRAGCGASAAADVRLDALRDRLAQLLPPHCVSALAWATQRGAGRERSVVVSSRGASGESVRRSSSE